MGYSKLIYVAIFVIIFGLIPLLQYSPDNISSVEMSNIIEKLELQNKELETLIASIESGSSSTGVQLLKEPSTESKIPDFTVSVPELATSVTAEHPLREDPAHVVPIPPLAANIIDFPLPITYNTPSSQSANSILVVGGTDGSGTRRVVQVLSQLGVVMVSEDPETYDIHADIVGGWPNVVTPILEVTESISYDPQKLPEKIRTRISESLEKLLNLADSDSRKRESHVLAVGGALPKPLNVKVSAINYGFKAPVAMTLAPYWAYLLKDFRMLHVLRDGRDIAFSANQGPVQKFYSSMYKKNPVHMGERLEVKAIRLWSDWNAGLKKWALEKVVKYADDVANAGKSFGYYAMHSEDLVDDDRDVRYSALANLAAWLGSDISDRDLCCIAVRGSEFLGSHDRTSKTASNALKLSSRYGKWKARLSGDKELGRSMISAGAPGLEEFGYEPSRDFHEGKVPHNPYSRFEKVNRPACTLQPVDCGVVELLDVVVPKIDLAVWGVSGLCTVVAGIDYKGGDISSFEISSSSLGNLNRTQCCRQCEQTPLCRFFTIDTGNNMCYLKSSNEHTQRTGMTGNLISGDMQ